MSKKKLYFKKKKIPYYLPTAGENLELLQTGEMMPNGYESQYEDLKWPYRSQTLAVLNAQTQSTLSQM